MLKDETTNNPESKTGPTRRQFLGTAGAVAGAAAIGASPNKAEAAKRHPKRGGTVRFATRADSRGLDQHPVEIGEDGLIYIDTGSKISG